MSTNYGLFPLIYCFLLSFVYTDCVFLLLLIVHFAPLPFRLAPLSFRILPYVIPNAATYVIPNVAPVILNAALCHSECRPCHSERSEESVSDPSLRSG